MPELPAYQPTPQDTSLQIESDTISYVHPDSSGKFELAPPLSPDDSAQQESPTLTYKSELPGTEHGFYTNYAEVFYLEALNHRDNQQQEAMTANEAQDLYNLIAEIDSQMLENLDLVQSAKFPGVEFTHTKIVIDKQAIDRIYGRQVQQSPQQSDRPADRPTPDPTRHTIIQFGSFGMPPEGHALSMGDGIIDRAIRESSMVSHRMDSAQPAEVAIEILGAPTGFGGAVTPEWHQAIKDKGQQANVELYQEYLQNSILPPHIAQATPEQQVQMMDKHQLMFQGTSRGSIIAYQLGQAMPETVQNKLSILMDNPAGHHRPEKMRWLKGLKLPLGLSTEYIGRAIFDDTLKSLMAGDKQRTQLMQQKLGLTNEDIVARDNYKMATALSEGLGLIKGETLEGQARRTYIRWAIEDPLRLKAFRKIKLSHQKFDSLAGIHDSEQGIRAAAIEGSHFFAPYQRYSTWKKINRANRQRHDAMASINSSNYSETKT